MQISPLVPLAPLSTHTQPLSFAVPAELHARFVDAAARAQRDVQQWITAHPGAGDAAFGAFLASQVGPPPASNDADVALSRTALLSRDAAHNAQAKWIDGDGINEAWQGAIASLEQRLGPEQAATGRALLHDARKQALDASMTFKYRYARNRPYVAEPAQLPLSPGITHAHGYSYPSGHATHAFVTAGVLAALDPTQAASAFALAEQVAYARVYAAAHFSSDVAMGAYVGAAYGAYLARAH
jgi:membrane-associated phospholipid phosphatase